MPIIGLVCPAIGSDAMTIAKFGAPIVKRTDGQESCAEVDRAQAVWSASHGGALSLMTGLGHERRFSDVLVMSAHAPRAAEKRTSWEVRVGPETDMRMPSSS
jgi:hypothetical protein